MRTRLTWVMALGCAAWIAGCGDDTDDADAGHSHGDGDHSHDSCGLQENCSDDAIVLSDEVQTIPSADGSYAVMIHGHDELTPNDDNEWMIMLMMDGMPVPGREIKVNTFSEDCGHPGDKPPMVVTTDDMGMVTVHPSFIHGGPWSVRVDPDASSDGEVITDDDDVIIELCVPGASHGDGDSGDGDHSNHG